jgi:hypothetical protein
MSTARKGNGKGRFLTLRGTYDLDDGAIGVQKELLDYISPDRTRAWRLEGAWLWPKDIQEDTGGSSETCGVGAMLATDTFKVTQFNDLLDAGDNRQCAWYWKQYQRRDGSTDYIIPNATTIPESCRFLIDEDTLIVKELYLQVMVRSEGATNPARRWNYLIALREVKVSPWESLFQQLKGIGQDQDS